MRGGVEGRLEFFQKFIRFGSATLPLEAVAFVRWLKNRGVFSSTTTSQFANLRSLILSHFPAFCKLYLLYSFSFFQKSTLLDLEGEHQDVDDHPGAFLHRDHGPALAS